jgi:hypothetical protein
MSNLNIIIKNATKEQKGDAKFGLLLLDKEGSYNISIQEIEDFLKKKPKIPTSFTSKVSDEKYQKLSDESRKDYNVAVAKHNKSIDKYNADSKKFSEDKAALLDKYKDLNWCYQLVGNGVNSKKISHNESFTKGIADILDYGSKSMSFSKLLEGGGMVWLEAFDTANPATGKSPRGLFIQATGTPQVLRSEWTDYKYNIIKEKAAFGSEVLLHVYTKGLYGQELEIELIDQDIFDPNDKLVANKMALVREVNVFKIQTNEFYKEGVDGILLKTDQKKDNAVVEQDQYIQKIEMKVLIDASWEKTAGESLKIFVAAKSIKTQEYFKGFERVYLEVGSNAKKFDIPNASVTNTPLVVGQVETNVAAFSPCRYQSIFLDSTNFKKAINVYSKDQQNAYSNEPIEIVSKQKNNNVQLVLDKLDTRECSNIKTAKDHNDSKNKFQTSDNIINPIFTSDKVFFDAIPPLLTEINFHDKFGIDPKKYFIKTETCAHSKNVELHVYPELGFEFSVRVGSGDPLFVRQSKAMTNRKYLHQADFFGKKAADKIKLKRKQDYEAEKSAKLLKFDEYELGFEYTIDSIDEPVENITLNGDTPIVKIFDRFMWMINNIRELSGDKAYDEAEKDHEEAKKSGGKPKNKYFNKVNKLGKKINKKIPIRIEVSQPKLAGTVKWAYAQSETEPERVGMLYTFNLKADPLIEVKGTLDLLFIAQFIPYVGAGIKGMTRFADGIGMMDDVVNFFLPEEEEIVIDLDYRLDMQVSGSLEFAAEAVKYHSIDGLQAGDFDIICKIEIGVVANIEFKFKFGKTEGTTAAGAKVAAKWTISKKKKGGSDKFDPWEIHFDGIYLEVYAKAEVTRKTDFPEEDTPTKPEPIEPPKRFCLQPSFTHEFQLYNPE